MWIEEDVLMGLTDVRVEEWSSNEGQNKMRQSGGGIEVGDEYSSDFLVVYPMKPLVKPGRSFVVKMDVKQSTGYKTYIYHSSDMSTWSKVSDVSFADGQASFRATSGMKFVVEFYFDQFCILSLISFLAGHPTKFLVVILYCCVLQTSHL